MKAWIRRTTACVRTSAFLDVQPLSQAGGEQVDGDRAETLQLRPRALGGVRFEGPQEGGQDRGRAAITGDAAGEQAGDVPIVQREGVPGQL